MTASGVELATEIALDKIEALRQEQLAFTILAHTLLAGARVDELLNYLRNRKLEIDFRLGRMNFNG